ncbi:hypothetical protein ACFQFR_36680 [Streptomyces goshikiensis]
MDRIGGWGPEVLEVFLDQRRVLQAFGGDVFQPGLEVGIVDGVRGLRGLRGVPADGFAGSGRDGHQVAHLALQAADLLLSAEHLGHPELLLFLRRHPAAAGELLLDPHPAQPLPGLSEPALRPGPLPLVAESQPELGMLQPALRVGEHRPQLREVVLRVRRDRPVLDDLLEGVIAPLAPPHQLPAGGR